jgi:peptide/nickel transport system substrate-binding protein
VRYRVRVLLVSALAMSLAAAGCAKNTGSGGGSGGNAPSTQAAIIVDKEGKTPVPAPEVPGAKKGGTLTWLEDGAVSHLDPQDTYVTDGQSIESLIFRTLTSYIEDPKGGPLKLVGDLATNTGESSDGDKTWTYHLRDGIKFEDGTPITSKDIAYGISRSMGKYGDQGPRYWPQDLDPNKTFTWSKGAIFSGLQTPDDKTLVIKFPDAHPETPFLAALNTTTPIPVATDNGQAHENDFKASGPYKQQGTWDQQTKLTLVKNPNWDPNTDPIRHQYPDTWQFDFTPDRDAQTQRVMADAAADQGALMTSNVSQGSIPQVQNDPSFSKRLIKGVGTFVDYLAINTSRVTDLKVRQAINYAFDRQAYIQALGGSAVAVPATELLSPTMPGFKKYDAYPSADDHGDVAKAKELLGGQTPKLTGCWPNTSTYQKYSVVVKNALERAGFQVTINLLDKSQYYDQIGEKTTTCDIMRYGWGADFPLTWSTISVLWNGKYIKDKGNNNVSYLNNPDLNKKLDALEREPDANKVAQMGGELDQEIMTKYAPVVPNYQIGVFLLTGSKVGGTFLSPLYANPNLVDAYYNG